MDNHKNKKMTDSQYNEWINGERLHPGFVIHEYQKSSARTIPWNKSPELSILYDLSSFTEKIRKRVFAFQINVKKAIVEYVDIILQEASDYSGAMDKDLSLPFELQLTTRIEMALNQITCGLQSLYRELGCLDDIFINHALDIFSSQEEETPKHEIIKEKKKASSSC